MQYFTSDISQKQFPAAEKVSGKAVQPAVFKEIIKAHPEFNYECHLAVSEVNVFRHQYVQNLLSKEVGVLSDLEEKVLENIQHNSLIADEASEIKNPTRGERWADRIALFGGSWKFIGLFALFLTGWMILNLLWLRNKGFDPYPFILLNLILSCLAAIQAPIIMMSQNRQEEKDRERAKNDYMVNLKSELEVRLLHEKMDHLLIIQQELLEKLNAKNR